MGRKWTAESAKSYINKVNKGKIPRGLTYYSAVDFLANHFKVAIDNYLKEDNAKEDDDSLELAD